MCVLWWEGGGGYVRVEVGGVWGGGGGEVDEVWFFVGVWWGEWGWGECMEVGRSGVGRG